MIDMHMHTVFSDGTFDDKSILKRAYKSRLLSVTDHNSVYMYLYLSKNNDLSSLLKRFVIGTELTIEGYPDFLLYYPDMDLVDKDALESIEIRLKEIRLREQENVKQAYEIMKEQDSECVFSTWEQDYIPVRVLDNIQIEARTRDLAALRYRKRTKEEVVDSFEKVDLRAARIARRQIRNNNTEIDNPFLIAKQTKAQIVLAHPIRASYIFAGRDKATKEDVINELKQLLFYAFENGCTVFEYEYLGQDAGRYQLLKDCEKELRQEIQNYVVCKGLSYVWGTDAHVMFPDEYQIWSDERIKDIGKLIPEWLRGRMDE